MRLNTLVWGSASALVLIALAATSPALAQEAAATDDAVSVGDIIVTAQKREQRLQDVPVTVTVATKQLLDDAGVDDIKDLQLLTPGLTVTSTTTEGSTTARIRAPSGLCVSPPLVCQYRPSCLPGVLRSFLAYERSVSPSRGSLA